MFVLMVLYANVTVQLLHVAQNATLHWLSSCLLPIANYYQNILRREHGRYQLYINNKSKIIQNNLIII